MIELIDYCNILTEVAKGKTKVVFINGLLPWTRDINTLEKVVDYANELSDYTKELVEFHDASPAEFDESLKLLQQKVASLNSTMWVNQFESMHDLTIDKGTDNSHPGYKSHSLYANMIIKYFKERENG